MRGRKVFAILLFPLCFLALAAAERNLLPVLLLSQTAIHEGGHLLAACLCRARIRGFGTQYFGISLVYEMDTLSYGKELFILLAGAAANLICAVPVFFLFPTLPEACFFSAAGLALALFNLLPFRLSDGGRALSAFCRARFPDSVTNRLASTLSLLCTVGFWLFAVVLQLRYRPNLSLLILSVYLLLDFFLCRHDTLKTRISEKTRE